VFSETRYAMNGDLRCGAVIDRLNTEMIAVASGAALSAAIIVPLTATTLVQAMAGAFLLGVTAGWADVGMNAIAVIVERDYGRPIMSAFHAVFSVGSVFGSLLGAAGFALHLKVWTTSSTTTALCLIIVACAFVGLRGYCAGDPTNDRCEVTPGNVDDRRHHRVLLLGLLAFLLFLSEGSAMDWGSIHAQQHLGVAPSSGALTVGSFMAAMTFGRFMADRVAAAVGPVRVLRDGAIVAMSGIVTVIIAPVLAVALVGWALFGLGLAGGLPQVFSAAGNLGGERSGRALSRVVGVGYVAILGGPALIGWMVQLTSWTGAFLVPLCAMAVCALSASVVSRDTA
jgi:predicted MFS family arabinose efflux permease